MKQSRRTSRRLLAIGVLLVAASITGAYFHPGLSNPVEITQGSISKAEFIQGNGGRVSLANQTLTAMLTVDYVVDGKPQHLEESVSTSTGMGEKFHGVGNPITVYIRRGKGDVQATLAEPKPLILVWIGMGIFGMTWIVLGWLVGRPVRPGKSVEKTRRT